MGKLELNAAQAAAVNITDGPVLVVAGAGTGKTRVIVERIIRLIESGVAPESILALTFTEKAAGEMQDRVSEARGNLTLDTTIATFNRFGNDLLTQYGSEWGLGRLRLLGDTGQLVFLREHFDELELDYFAPISKPDGQLELLAGYVSQLKQQLVTPDEYLQYVETLPTADEAEQLDKQKHQELAQFFETYLALCRREQVIDYDDQLYLTIELLTHRPNILKSLQERYQYILVDEFQDTNPMQSKLVDMIAERDVRLHVAEAVSVRSRESQASRIDDTVQRDSQGSKPKMASKSAESHAPHESRRTGACNLMVVGDDDQSIYGWRGATLANILDFKQRYPDAQEITLIENYRSTQQILDGAYQLIQHNNPHRLEVMNQLDKRLHGQATGPGPAVQHFSSYEAELAWVADDIGRRLQKGQAPGSIAVLARRNQGVKKVHEILELHGVAHAVAGLSNDMYAQTAVRQLIEALKTIADPLDSVALFHTLSGPLFDLDIGQLANFSSTAQREHESLGDIIAASEDASYKAAIAQIAAWREIANEQSVGNLAYALMTDSGWKQRLYAQAQEDENAVATDIQALSKFFATLKEFERIAGVPSVQNYIVNLPVLQAAGSQFEDVTMDIVNDQVNVLSVHRSKGLEWDTVYIVDCSEGSFPLRAHGSSLKVPEALQAHPSEADEHLAEERRLMYVTATRARQELIMSYADRHGNGAPRKPSRFISELLGHEPTTSAQDEATQTSLELFAPTNDASTTIPLPAGMLQNERLMLSVSQIECWLRCPQDFYYKYVLSMPLPPAPQLTYGSLVHGVIERIHKGRLVGAAPTLEQLTKDVVDGLPKAGYESKRSRERAHAQAIKTVQAVYERFMHDDLPIETELPFSLEVPDLPLTIRGRIDAVYQLPNGVEIRDYKTGTSVRTAEQAKSRATGSQQLTLYALAWQELRGAMPAKLSLDFVETGQSYGVKKQSKSLDTLHTKLAQMVKDLQVGNYPSGKDHKHCMHPVSDN